MKAGRPTERECATAVPVVDLRELPFELLGKPRAHFRCDLSVGEHGDAEHEPFDGLGKAEPLLVEPDVAVLHVIASGHTTTRPTWVRRDILIS